MQHYIKQKLYSFVKSFLDPVLIVIVIGILTFRWALFEPYVIPSGSMIPSLLINDHIIVQKFSYGLHIPFMKKWLMKGEAPQKGDVVVFRPLLVKNKMKFMIKRVLAVEGDEVYIAPDKQIWINGQKTHRTLLQGGLSAGKSKGYYTLNPQDMAGADVADYQFYEEQNGNQSYRIIFNKNKGWHDVGFGAEFTVPKGHVFVTGDNRDNSHDSRYWGSLPMTHIIGKARWIWLSCEKTFMNLPLLCYPHRLRQKRILKTIK